MNGEPQPPLSDPFHDRDSPEALLDVVYEELRKLAANRMRRESADNTLQATALVHEAWLRLGAHEGQRWDSRAHFFGSAAEAMRRILIDRARRNQRPKHGGDLRRTEFDDVELVAGAEEEILLEVNEQLDRLADEDSAKAEVVKLKFFVGLSNAEAAEALGVSEKTVGRHWRYAKAWLYRAIRGRSDG